MELKVNSAKMSLH